MDSPQQVLIVDDDVNTADYIAELLQAEGYGTSWAFDGQEALSQLRRAPAEAAGVAQPYDLMILDVMMPGIMTSRIIRS